MSRSDTGHEPDDPRDDVGAQIRRAALEVRAPSTLRARVTQVRADARAPRRRPRRTWSIAAGAATVVAVVLLALLVLAPGAAAPPSVHDVATLALRVPDGPAPPPAPDDPRYVDASVGSIRFPSNAYTASSSPSGVREARLTGRRVVAVSYGEGDGRVGYAVVDGPVLPWPAGAARIRAGTVPVATYVRDGAQVVTWRRDGHTCVVASRTAPLTRLLRYVRQET